MKYKLLKDLPGIAAGAEFIEHEETETFSRLAFSHVPCVGPEYAKNNPDFFEPIVEKKTYDDLNYGDKVWYIYDDGSVTSTIYNAYNCYTRSETFLTREEAEDEHKRREWACRKNKFVPKKGEYYWHYSVIEGYVNTDFEGFNADYMFINYGLAFRTREECEKSIKEHDLIRLFYTIR